MARVQITADEGELETKALPLARQLLAGLAAHDSRLEKALVVVDDLHEGHSPLESSPAMQVAIASAHEIYEEEMRALFNELAQVLEEA